MIKGLNIFLEHISIFKITSTLVVVLIIFYFIFFCTYVNVVHGEFRFYHRLLSYKYFEWIRFWWVFFFFFSAVISDFICLQYILRKFTLIP